ncbi:hypothetical protein GOBAR_AA02446 [Gossypium barbadense]|uniref:Uncharacterized protein n=1 Tax=Gossypium barbadense TaxID=3634 RepID=A0A2P5YRC4_GOSBA|nr:hypothetical protein GOBAR_AA02446 [Gossypium barbadense]
MLQRQQAGEQLVCVRARGSSDMRGLQWCKGAVIVVVMHRGQDVRATGHEQGLVHDQRGVQGNSSNNNVQGWM